MRIKHQHVAKLLRTRLQELNWSESESDLAEHIAPVMPPTSCKDCGADKHVGYMVTNELWEDVAKGDVMLCRDCFERRLGRTLTPQDLTDVPMNHAPVMAGNVIKRHVTKLLAGDMILGAKSPLVDALSVVLGIEIDLLRRATEADRNAA